MSKDLIILIILLSYVFSYIVSDKTSLAFSGDMHVLLIDYMYGAHAE